MTGTGLEDFEAYAASLLDSVVPTSPLFDTTPGSPSKDSRPPTIMEAPPSQRPEMLARDRTESAIALDGNEAVGEEEPSVGCKAAIEIVSRTSQKGSFPS